MKNMEKSEISVVSKGIHLTNAASFCLIAPLILLLGMCFLGSIMRIIFEVFQGGFGSVVLLYQDILSRSLFQLVAFRTVWISVVVTIITVVIGYATAYSMWRSSPGVRNLLVAMILFPMFTSIVVRTYAWTTLLNRNGLINKILLDVGAIDAPLRMIKTEGAVLIGMVQVLLPFAILPIYSILSRLDENLLRASAIAGARGWQTFINVIFPLSKEGTTVATILVFVISLGFFITPAILGGPRAAMISNLIGMEVTIFFDLRDGAAMALILLIVTLGLLGSASKIGSLAESFKSQNR